MTTPFSTSGRNASPTRILFTYRYSNCNLVETSVLLGMSECGRGMSVAIQVQVVGVGRSARVGQGVDAAVDVGGKPLGPAGVGAQRHDEPQPFGVGGAQLAQVPEPGVDDADHAGRGQLTDTLEGCR